MDEKSRHSEELFEVLSKNKKKRRRKVIRTVLTVLLVLFILAVAGVAHLRNQVRERFAAAETAVESYTVTNGTIHTVVSGTGVLNQVDLENLAVPAGVIITEVLVEERDAVTAGEILATVDMASVLNALSDIQQQLDDLDAQISDAKGDTVSSSIRAGVSGRVKQIYAGQDDDVTSCMAKHGALAVLSLDGYMAVDLETDKLEKGQTVLVVDPEGKEMTGLVDKAAGGKVTVLVSDNGPVNGCVVRIQTTDAVEVGSGTLYIHSPLIVTGYAGTVSSVSVKENAKVYANTTLFRLTDTSFSANYDILLRQREDLEETLMELLTIYRDGAVLAKEDGQVSQILFDEEGAEDQVDILTFFPNKQMSVTISVDETDILSLEEGQIAEVMISSVSEELFAGEVTKISREATTSSGVTTYSAEITLDIQPGMLPGMTAEVDVKIQGSENARIIPVDALHQTSAIYFVYTEYDPENRLYGGMREVTVGMQNDQYVEILSGLEPGDTVYYVEAQQGWFGFPMGGRAPSGNRGSSGGQRPNGGAGR